MTDLNMFTDPVLNLIESEMIVHTPERQEIVT